MLQGKCADKNNVLPDGPSTEKERKLFESVNRNKKPILYPGTKASGASIGSYTLGGNTPGLADCAKYLMMPKHEKWNYKAPKNTHPYVIGWPESLTSKSLGLTSNYLDAVIHELLQSQSMGKEVKFNNGAIDRTCEWSKMIDDLLTSYQAVTMKGYNCQRRFYNSSEDIPDIINGLSLMTHHLKSLRFLSYKEHFILRHWPRNKKYWQHRFENLVNDVLSDQGPIISTITVNVDYHEGEYIRG